MLANCKSVMQRLHVLIDKCVTSAHEGSHATKFLRDTIKSLGSSLASDARKSAEELSDEAMRTSLYDMVEDVEDGLEFLLAAAQGELISRLIITNFH